MTGRTSIEWTELTWNPVVGCAVISPGCTNCYAMRMGHRLAAMGSGRYAGLTRVSGGRAKWTGQVRLVPEVLRQPTKIRRGSIIFVNSMSDLFHEDVPLEYILQVFQIMKETPRHIYQVLTKRADRLLALSTRIEWPHNVWMGVSVESQDYADRVDMLKETEAEVKFLSLEPLLGPLALDLSGIDWVIAGGESGPSARPIEADWVRSLRDLCVASETAFHFKQWGGVNKKRSGRTLDSRTWQQWPIDMQRWVQAEGPTAQSDLLS